MKRALLILRPEPGASATAARAVALGLTMLVRPLFETRAIDWTAPDAAEFDAVLLTSANSVRLGGDQVGQYCHLPVYAVGEATAEAARSAGFAKVIVGNADAETLVKEITRAGCRNVLYLAGRDRTAKTATEFETVVVYASDVLPIPDLPRAAVALLHSTRAALRFAEVVQDKSTVAVVAISATVAKAAGLGWQSIAVAASHTDAAMLALAATLCETADE